MVGAVESQASQEGGVEPGARASQPGREIDVRALLKALPDPELPAGLEDRLRAFLQGRRGHVGH
jgi:hypothetical protein